MVATNKQSGKQYPITNEQAQQMKNNPGIAEGYSFSADTVKEPVDVKQLKQDQGKAGLLQPPVLNEPVTPMPPTVKGSTVNKTGQGKNK